MYEGQLTETKEQIYFHAFHKHLLHANVSTHLGFAWNIASISFCKK